MRRLFSTALMTGVEDTGCATLLMLRYVTSSHWDVVASFRTFAAACREPFDERRPEDLRERGERDVDARRARLTAFGPRSV